MSHICNAGRAHVLTNGFSGIDLACTLVMVGSTVATERSKDTVSVYTTLAEYDGDGMDRQLIIAANYTLTRNDTLNRLELAFDNPVTFASVAAASANAIGMLVALVIGADEDADASNIPLAFINSSPAFPRNGSGGDLVFTGAALGVVRFGG